MIYKFFDKKSSNANTSGSVVKGEIMQNQELAEELKPIIKNLKNKKYTHFLKTIFGVLILLICNK